MQQQHFQKQLYQDTSTNNQLLLQQYWLKWKQYIRSVHRQRQIQTSIMIMQNHRQQKIIKLALSILNDYTKYKVDKRMRNIEVYHLIDRRRQRKVIRGFCIYTSQLRDFQKNLQEVYCKWIYRKYFDEIVKFRRKGLKNLNIRIEMLEIKIKRRQLQEYMVRWKIGVLQSKERKLETNRIFNKIAEIIYKHNFMTVFLRIQAYNQSMIETIKDPKPFVPLVPIQRNASQLKQELFEFKRKYAPIRDISRKVTERIPDNRHTPPRQPPQPHFRNTMQDFDSGKKQSRSLRILNNLIQIKQTEIAWLCDPVFDGDSNYDSYRSRLRLELGHYLQILHDIEEQ